MKLVEIRTKVASVFPLLIGLLFAQFYNGKISVLNSLIMFISLIMFDMTTTTINNYMDYKRAIKKDGYNYEIHNAIVQYNLSEKTVIAIIFIMFMIASIFGVLLFIRTDYLILILGMISFITGILYSYGPIPISYTPLGEIFSGLFMGFLIFFIAFYVNMTESLISVFMKGNILTVDINIILIIKLLIASLPLVIAISNIMLANNICDVEDDLMNKRYTLPSYLGNKMSLFLFKSLYYIAFIFNIFIIFVWKLPIETIIVLFGYILVFKNANKFLIKQEKKSTFEYSVKNQFFISLMNIIILFYSLIK